MYELNDRNSYTLKISRSCVHQLRFSELFLDDARRGLAILIIDSLSDYVDGKLVYPLKSTMIKHFRDTICSNDLKLKGILIDLEFIGCIVIRNDRLTQYKKPKWELQISKLYQTQDWYTFTDDMPEFQMIDKLKKRKIAKRKRIWNDDKLVIDEKYLKFMEDEFVNTELIELMRKRNSGVYVQSETMKSKVGRFYGIYSNIKREYRKFIKDSNTGEYLIEIDNKASQISFLLSYLEIINKTTNSETFRLELDELKEIQRTISFHDYFSNAINSKTNIDRDTIKPLVFKFMFGSFDNHDNPYFNREVKDEFNKRNYNIELVWNTFVTIFKRQFPETYRILSIEHNKLKFYKTSIAAKVQKNESNWLKDIIKRLVKIANTNPEFQYYTLHDSVAFSKQFFPEVLAIIKEVNQQWNVKCGVELNYKISGIHEIEKAHINHTENREKAIICAFDEIVDTKLDTKIEIEVDTRIHTWIKSGKEYWRIRSKKGNKTALKSKVSYEEFLEIAKEWLKVNIS